jgi:pilus assembly protein CpaB
MRAVFGLVLILGVGLAGFAVWMVQGYFEDQQRALARERAAAADQVPTVEVYAVNRVVTYGEMLTPEDVTLIRYAEPFLPEGVFTTEEALFPEGADLPRSVLRQMEPNEPVLAVKVTEPGQPAGLGARLTEGMRAFAISVDATSGVSGFLRPGDRVDVYWTGQVNNELSGNGGGVTQLIESGVEIIAIDQSTDDNMTQALVARTVTVQVDPQQVANLAQAQSTGTLSLSLVGHGDATVAEAIEVDQQSLLGIEEVAPVIEVAVEPEQVCTIRTRRGAEVVEIPIPCTNG